MRDGHCPGMHIECCRRGRETCRDRQSGEHVGEKSHRQSRVPAAGGVAHPPERRLSALGGLSRTAADEDDGIDCCFGIRFSVTDTETLMTASYAIITCPENLVTTVALRPSLVFRTVRP